MSTLKYVKGILFAQMEGELYFYPPHLLHQLFQEPLNRHEACKAFQARSKPPHRLCDINNPNSPKLYRFDDLPQLIHDPNQTEVIIPFVREEYPMLQAQVCKAFGLKRKATIATQTFEPEKNEEASKRRHRRMERLRRQLAQ